KRTYLAWLTTLAPIWMSFSRSGVSVRPRIGLGRTSCRSKFARLYARANSCNRAALPLNRRHDSLVHLTAFLPPLIHGSPVPRRLESRATFCERHLRLVTRKPTRGNNSLACHPPWATPRRAHPQDFAWERELA